MVLLIPNFNYSIINHHWWINILYWKCITNFHRPSRWFFSFGHSHVLKVASYSAKVVCDEHYFFLPVNGSSNSSSSCSAIWSSFSWFRIYSCIFLVFFQFLALHHKMLFFCTLMQIPHDTYLSFYTTSYEAHTVAVLFFILIQQSI